MPQASVSSGTAPSDETASTTSERVADCLLERAHVGDDARRRVGLLAEHDLDAGSRHRRGDLVRIGLLAPLVADRPHVEPVLLADRDPALAEGAVADDRDAVAGRQRLATAESMAPEPEALNTSTSDSVRQTSRSRSSARS